MSHYLVYVPREHCEAAQQLDATRSPLEHVGLSDHAAGAFSLAVSDGPDNKGGMLFAWQPNNGAVRLHYRANEQDWIPAVPRYDQPAERYWLGFWRDSPVTPVDLRRREFVAGRTLTLGDGNRWIVPGSNLLPQRAAFAPDGSWKTVVDERFSQYHNEVMSWVLELSRGLDGIDYPELFEFAARALGINYRFARELVPHLNLFTQQNAVELFKAATLPVEPEELNGLQ